MIRVEVVLAWPDRAEARQLELADGATVAAAIAAAAIEGSEGCPAAAVHGLLARRASQVLNDGDRVELLRPLLADPKDNRRKRARAR